MKKTIINYSLAGAFAGSLLMNVAFGLIINDTNKQLDYLLNDKALVREEYKALENDYKALEKKNVELSEQVIVLAKEASKKSK